MRKKAKELTEAEWILETWLGSKPYEFLKEYRFHSEREWRFDYFIWRRTNDGKGPTRKASLALEVEGITYRGPGTRHQRGAGYEKDCEKYANAVIAGYSLLRVTPNQIKSGVALGWIDEFFKK